MKRHAVRLASVALPVALTLTMVASGCSLESLAESSGVVNVVIGYQSKTINTVTAGTLLRAQGYLEHSSPTSRRAPEPNTPWVAGLRHRCPDHRADGRRKDRHRLHGRLPDADQRL